jgi:hypothetical protein
MTLVRNDVSGKYIASTFRVQIFSEVCGYNNGDFEDLL